MQSQMWRVVYPHFNLFNYYMTTEKILKSYTVAQLRKEISATNIKGFTKMKRADLHAVIMKNKERFSHLKEQVKERKPRKTKPKAEPKPKPSAPKSTKFLPPQVEQYLKQFTAVDTKDAEKKKMRRRDSDYFKNKVGELIKRKTGIDYRVGKDAKKYNNFMDAFVNFEANSTRPATDTSEIASEKGMGAAALHIAKILTNDPVSGPGGTGQFFTTKPIRNFLDQLLNVEYRKWYELDKNEHVDYDAWGDFAGDTGQWRNQGSINAGTKAYYKTLFQRYVGVDNNPLNIFTVLQG